MKFRASQAVRLFGVASALAIVIGFTSGVFAHPTDTTTTISLAPAASVPEGTTVTITGKVVTTGQAAVTSPPPQIHSAVDANQPVTVGTLKIQECIDGGVGVPKSVCEVDSEKWVDCPTCSVNAGSPDSFGEMSATFSTAGLAGNTIGFRVHYITPGGSHVPGTSHSEGRDLTITSSVLTVAFDIKPGGCPNPLNLNAKGVLPVAILGTVDFDVNDINLMTVKLEGVSPLRASKEDVATPFTPFDDKSSALDCNELGADGYTDLTLKFDLQQVVQNLSVNDGDVVVLYITGQLNDGTDFEGQDVVQILKKK